MNLDLIIALLANKNEKQLESISDLNLLLLIDNGDKNEVEVINKYRELFIARNKDLLHLIMN